LGKHSGRSAEALAYRRHYNTARWRGLRLTQLSAQPLCVMCLEAGRVTPATVVDHVTPHKGDEALFYAPANLQSLCDAIPFRCHSRVKQGEERHAEDDQRRGYSTAIGADGYPIDPAHPSNVPRPI
jgi:5-methylcytosine-specific restriction endonuclease McrA